VVGTAAGLLVIVGGILVGVGQDDYDRPLSLLLFISFSSPSHLSAPFLLCQRPASSSTDNIPFPPT
jgi:hypothetical protein